MMLFIGWSRFCIPSKCKQQGHSVNNKVSRHLQYLDILSINVSKRPYVESDCSRISITSVFCRAFNCCCVNFKRSINVFSITINSVGMYYSCWINNNGDVLNHICLPYILLNHFCIHWTECYISNMSGTLDLHIAWIL